MSTTFVTLGIPGIAVLMVGAALCAWGWLGSRRFTAAYPDDSIAVVPMKPPTAPANDVGAVEEIGGVLHREELRF